jgi:hypothetical protein
MNLQKNIWSKFLVKGEGDNPDVERPVMECLVAPAEEPWVEQLGLVDESVDDEA